MNVLDVDEKTLPTVSSNCSTVSMLGQDSSNYWVIELGRHTVKYWVGRIKATVCRRGFLRDVTGICVHGPCRGGEGVGWVRCNKMGSSIGELRVITAAYMGELHKH